MYPPGYLLDKNMSCPSIRPYVPSYFQTLKIAVFDCENLPMSKISMIEWMTMKQSHVSTLIWHLFYRCHKSLCAFSGSPNFLVHFRKSPLPDSRINTLMANQTNFLFIKLTFFIFEYKPTNVVLTFRIINQVAPPSVEASTLFFVSNDGVC